LNKKVSGQDTSQDFIKPLYIDYVDELKPFSEETPERQNLILSNMITGLQKITEDKIIVPPPEILIKAKSQIDVLTKNMRTGRELTVYEDGTQKWNIEERSRPGAIIDPSEDYDIWSYFNGRYDEKDEYDIRKDPKAWEFLLSELEFEEERGESNIVFMVMFRRLNDRDDIYLHWKFIDPKILTKIISKKSNDNRGLIAEEVYESDFDEINELFMNNLEVIRDNYQAIGLKKDGSIKYQKFSTYITTVLADKLRKRKKKLNFVSYTSVPRK